MADDRIKTFTLHITGKVQGVWYRASAKDKALELGLKGKVWNNPDDSVGVVVQGPETNVKQFIEWCKEGPRLASVDEVRFEETVSEFLFEGFDITRK